MSPLAWVTMTAVCGVVWGGLVLLLVLALRSERRKQASD